MARALLSETLVRLVIVGIVAGTTGCVVPFAVPPLKADLGAAMPVAHVNAPTEPARSGVALHAAVGVSAASGSTRTDLPFDLWAGALVETSGEGATVKGGYAEGAVFVLRDGPKRVSVGVRVEVRDTALGMAMATKARLEAEVVTPGRGSFEGHDTSGLAAGVYEGSPGIGLYAEAGPSWTPEGAAFVASAGVSVRIPSALGVYIGVPWRR